MGRNFGREGAKRGGGKGKEGEKRRKEKEGMKGGKRGGEEDERKEGKEERGVKEGWMERRGGSEKRRIRRLGGRSTESHVALLKLSSNLYFTNLCFQDFERYNCTASLYCVRILNPVFIM